MKRAQRLLVHCAKDLLAAALCWPLIQLHHGTQVSQHGEQTSQTTTLLCSWILTSAGFMALSKAAQSHEQNQQQQ